jgi:hypothetical protein
MIQNKSRSQIFQTLFGIIKDTGENYPKTGAYEPGLSTVQAVFSALTNSGDILTRERDIRTVTGGAISLLAPAQQPDHAPQ